MSQGDALRVILERLGAAGIPHMLVGSFASAYHGTPRTTQDIDLVIEPTAESLQAFIEGLSSHEFYVSAEAAREALDRRSQFNVVALATGWKVDLIIRKGRSFSKEEFHRREEARIFGLCVHVASAEDTVISKLEWAAMGESERQLRDVAGVVSVKGRALDRDYIEGWARELGLVELWRRALEIAENE